MEGRDPDSFGTTEEFVRGSRLKRLSVKFAPGSGHPLSICYLLLAFTFHAQVVLWVQSRQMPGFGHLKHRRAIFDSIIMILFWMIVCTSIGLRSAICIVIIPMMIANAVIMAYIYTNHMLRPLTDTHAVLTSTMSVTTHWLLDLIHFNFSHHVEHHLFPGMSSHYYPLVRQSLRRHMRDQYMAPPHLWALWVLFKTPRVYQDAHTLIEPYSGRKVCLTDVEQLLTEALS
jgi:fatty acid desaturase